MSEIAGTPLTARAVRSPTPALTVLILDPQPEGRSLLKAALRGLNFVDHVMERGQHHALVEYLTESPANLVMIEEELGDADPFELVKQIKTNPATARTKFVLMSSNLTMESRRKGIEVGILGFLAKPFDIQSLEKAIRDAMGKVSTNHKETLDKVRRIAFFAGFSDMELVRLLKICHTRKFQAGEPVFRQGEKGDRLYVLLSGEVDILKRLNGGTRLLATMKAGDVFGEMAIVDQEPRSADALAKSDAMMIEVHDQVINDLNDPLALKLFRKFAMLVTKKLRDFTRSAAASGNQ
jgi:CheY-like chemotaxis protein